MAAETERVLERHPHVRLPGLPGDVVQVRLLERDRTKKKWQASLIQAPMVQAALFSMELTTGKVRVLMGGKDFGDSTFNRAMNCAPSVPSINR